MTTFKDGSATRPFTDIKTALENPRLSAGDVVYLRGGIHRVYEDITISASEITICPAPGQVAKIEVYGNLERPQQETRWHINGDNIRFRNLEIAGMPTLRTTNSLIYEYPDSLWIDVNGVVAPDGLFGACTLHDFITCTWFDDHPGELQQVLYIDSLVYNVGFMRTDDVPDGECVYSQNALTSATKSIVNTILGPTFSIMTQLYGKDGVVHHWLFDKTIFLSGLTPGSRWYIHPGTSMSDIRATGCISFGAGLWLGNSWGGNINVDAVLDSCYLVKSDQRSQKIASWSDRTVTNNTLINLSNSGEYTILIYDGIGLAGTSNWDNNTYYDGSPTAGAFSDQNSVKYTFEDWKTATGFDANSQLIVGVPSVNQLLVYPCTTAPRIAHLALANWQELDHYNADISSLNLTPGQTYRLRSAYNPLIDTVDFVYDGSGVIALTLTGRTVAIPVAWSEALIEIDHRFGVWILEST